MQLGRTQIQRDSRELRRHRHRHHGRDAHIVQHAEQPAAEKPEHAERTLKHAIAGSTAGLRHHLRDGGLQDRLLRAHANAPERDAYKQRADTMAREHEHRKRRRQHRRPHERLHALFIIQQSEHQRRHGVDQHGPGIQQRQRPAADERGRLRKAGGEVRVRARDVHEHERIVDEAEREQADARNVEHELFFHLEGHVFLRLGLKVLGFGNFRFVTSSSTSVIAPGMASTAKHVE